MGKIPAKITEANILEYANKINNLTDLQKELDHYIEVEWYLYEPLINKIQNISKDNFNCDDVFKEPQYNEFLKNTNFYKVFCIECQELVNKLKMTQISGEIADLTSSFSSLENLMEDRKQLMTRIISLDQEFQELYFKLYVVIKRTGNDVENLLCYRKDTNKCTEIIQEIKELQRQQRLHHKIFEVLHSAKLKEDPSHPPIFFENKQQVNLLEESIKTKKEKNFNSIKKLLAESHSTNKKPMSLDSLIFNARNSKKNVAKVKINDILNVKKESGKNWAQEIAELEKRNKKLLEQKDEHRQKEEALAKLKKPKLTQLDEGR